MITSEDSDVWNNFKRPHKFLVCKQETLSLEEVGWNEPINETFVLLSLQQLLK